MTVAVQQGRSVAFKPKRSIRKAVREAVEALGSSKTSYLTFDLSVDTFAAAELARWITEFKRLYQETVIRRGQAVILPSIAVFADRFTDEDERQLEDVGAILFDRSLPCNHDCQTPVQLAYWLAQNRDAAVGGQDQKDLDLPAPPPNGISPEDLKALNSRPAGMTEEQINRLLELLEASDPQMPGSEPCAVASTGELPSGTRKQAETESWAGREKKTRKRGQTPKGLGEP